MSGILELKQKLIGQLAEAAVKAQQAGKLPAVALPEISLEHPQKANFGDYATSFPLKLSRAAGVKPMSIAAEIVGQMVPCPEVESIKIAPPGFINFTLKSEWLDSQVVPILQADENYGCIDFGKGKRTQIEGKSFSGSDGETTNLVPTCKNNLPDWIPAPVSRYGTSFAGVTYPPASWGASGRPTQVRTGPLSSPQQAEGYPAGFL